MYFPCRKRPAIQNLRTGLFLIWKNPLGDGVPGGSPGYGFPRRALENFREIISIFWVPSPPGSWRQTAWVGGAAGGGGLKRKLVGTPPLKAGQQQRGPRGAGLVPQHGLRPLVALQQGEGRRPAAPHGRRAVQRAVRGGRVQALQDHVPRCAGLASPASLCCDVGGAHTQNPCVFLRILSDWLVFLFLFGVSFWDACICTGVLIYALLLQG